MSKILETFFSEIQQNKKPVTTTPRIILIKYGVGRRGWRVTLAINNLLKNTS